MHCWTKASPPCLYAVTTSREIIEVQNDVVHGESTMRNVLVNTTASNVGAETEADQKLH